MIKPEGYERALTGDVIQRFEKKGYKLVGVKMIQPTREQLYQHYYDLRTQDWFQQLIDHMVLFIGFQFFSVFWTHGWYGI